MRTHLSAMSAPLQGLAPFCPARPLLLVLGSFPSARSLEKGEYYGHERNHFWPIIAELARTRDFAPALAPAAPAKADRAPPAAQTAPAKSFVAPECYHERLALLEQAGLALWDVFQDCERKGSLDKDIRNARPNPLREFIVAHPTITGIGLNGGAAAVAFFALFRDEIEAGAAFPAKVGAEAVWHLTSPVSTPTEAAASRTLAAGLAEASGLRDIVLVRLPSTSPVPTAAFKRAADKLPFWQAFYAKMRFIPT